ncbi:hypothetical protein P7C73_g5148, partial [Tremellales sp. Uapishka_1]
MPGSLPPTHIVIVHGAYHCPAHYERLSTALTFRGFIVHAPHLPSSQYEWDQVDSPPPAEGWPSHSGDAKLVRDLVVQLVDQGERVLLFGHSAGCWTVSEALNGLPSEAERSVIGAIYCCGYLVGEGQHIGQAFMEFTPHLLDEVAVYAHGFDGLCSFKDPVKLFYADLPAAESARLVKLLRPAPALSSPLSSSAFQSVPSAYIYTRNDIIVPLAMQEELVRRARARGLNIMKEYRFDTAHSPYINKIAEMVDAVVEFVAVAGQEK